MEIMSDTALNNVTSPGLYFCGAGLNVSNTPPNPLGETAFSLLVERTYAAGIKQTLSWYYTGSVYYRTFDGESWHDWLSNATATPPEEIPLPLAEGITALQPCTCYKNQFSEVTLGGCASGSVSDGATIATLPEGFRPGHPVERPASFTSSGNRYAGSVFITADGIVSIHTPAAATNVVFAASFLAEN